MRGMLMCGTMNIEKELKACFAAYFLKGQLLDMQTIHKHSMWVTSAREGL